MEMQTLINDWMVQNSPMMVQCPHQPGHLLISRHVCDERRKKARIQNYASLLDGSLIDYMHKMGLFICLHCPEEN